jgi:hypothetical protein
MPRVRRERRKGDTHSKPGKSILTPVLLGLLYLRRLTSERAYVPGDPGALGVPGVNRSTWLLKNKPLLCSNRFRGCLS